MFESATDQNATQRLEARIVERRMSETDNPKGFTLFNSVSGFYDPAGVAQD